jgi:hypothetical protein
MGSSSGEDDLELLKSNAFGRFPLVNVSILSPLFRAYARRSVDHRLCSEADVRALFFHDRSIRSAVTNA